MNYLQMDRRAYDRRSFRNLPREYCEVSDLLGPLAGECAGYIHRHHVDPEDADSRTLQCCNRHHQHLHSLLRKLTGASEKPWKTCTHHHPYPEGKIACERRLNGISSAA